MAEVSTTVRWAKSRFRSTRPTSSGATRSVGGRRESSANGRSSQTTSPRSVISSPNASRIRLAVRCSSSSEARVTRADAIFCGSSSSGASLAWIASRHAPAASRTEVRVAASVPDSSSSRPAGASPRSMASAAPVSRSRSATAVAPSIAARLGQPPGAAGGHVHRRSGQFSGGGRGDPVHQVVRLVDDHHVVIGQHVDLGRRVDGQQRMVGHYDVRTDRLVPGLLGETAGAERAALRADALLGAHRDLAPGGLGHSGHELVPVPGGGLLGPLVQPLDLPPQRGGQDHCRPGRTARPEGRPPRRPSAGAGTGSCACPSGWRKPVPGRAAA